MLESNLENIVGIDYSINSPGVCIHPNFDSWNVSDVIINVISSYGNDCFQTDSGLILNFEPIQMKPKDFYLDRYEELRVWLLSIMPESAEVAIEDYSFGAKGRMTQLAENAGIAKHTLHKLGYPISTIAPGTVKKYATGNGHASKGLVVEKFGVETGIDLPTLLKCKSDASPATDIADSYFICKHHWQTFNQLSIQKSS